MFQAYDRADGSGFSPSSMGMSLQLLSFGGEKVENKILMGKFQTF